MKLKHRLFVDALMSDPKRNGRAAAISAGYSDGPGLDVTVRRLLRNSTVLKLIEDRERHVCKTAGVTPERIVVALANKAFLDPADVVVVRDPISGELRTMQSEADVLLLPPDVRAGIAGWSYDKQGRFILKLADSNAALLALGRYRAIFNDKLDVTVNEGLAERVKRAKERAGMPE